MPGTVLSGRYRLVALLGRGGMGEVYRADDLRLGQTVALKFLPEDLAHDPESRDRFYAELRLGRQVADPNVCRLYDLVDADGHQCLSMAYVEGEDLASLLRRLGRLPPEKALEVARDICAGLAAIHEQGVVHRDLKPGNVMIDGRGRALITDFGIAALVDRDEDAAVAGTPAYMAPELLDGTAASAQSDLYAFGLLLVETFCGRRLFDGRSPAELKRQRLAGAPPLATFAPEIPRELLPLIEDCLAADPQQRPSSARQLLQRMPGADPMQRALAAGETPTPAMVAASSRVGDLPPPVAWLLLLVALGCLWALAALSPHSTLIGRLQPQKPPEVLAERARDLLRAVGMHEPARDQAFGYFFDATFYARLRGRAGSVAIDTANEKPGPLRFLYRYSPAPLVAHQVRGELTAPAEVGRISRDDPPGNLPGMAEVVLDRDASLISLRIVPARQLGTPSAAAVDWQVLLAASGLAGAGLAATEPVWSAPVDNDARFAWTGHRAGPDSPMVRIEAAALRGQPVWFELIDESPATRASPADLPYLPLVLGIFLVFGIVMYATVIGLLARNLRQRRGDTRGALRLAIAVFGLSVFGLLLRADHRGSLLTEAGFLVNIITQSFYFAVVIWASYLAMEPFARRMWPHLLVSWTRMLAGCLRDPLVGRDILLGGLCGIALVLAAHLEVVLPSWFGAAEQAPLALAATPLNGSRHLLFLMSTRLYFCIELALCALFFRYLGARLLRYSTPIWVAMAGLFFLPLVFFLFPTAALGGSIPYVAVGATLVWMLLLWRVGLLAAVVCVWFGYVLQATPLNLDFSVWYAPLSLLSPGLLIVLLVYGFHIALAGRPWLALRLMEPERGA